MTRRDGVSELPSLTGLRGVLALWVLIFHIGYAAEYAHFAFAAYLPSALVRLVFTGNSGVDGFFVLSGFILSHVYQQSLSRGFRLRSACAFYGLRLSRIWPVHVVLLLLYAGLPLCGLAMRVQTCGVPPDAVPCNRFGAIELLAQLSLTANWGWVPILTWNPPAWTISSEWFAYLGFPLLILPLARLQRPLLAFGLAVMAVVSLALWLAHTGTPLDMIPGDSVSLTRVSFEFLAGMLLYRCFASPLYQRIRWDRVASLTVLAFAVVIAIPSSLSGVLLSLLFLPLLLSLAQPRGPVSRCLASAPLQWLGRISYSLYLCHVWVLETLGAVFDTAPNAAPPMSLNDMLAMTAAVSAFSILLAALLYHLIEEPCRKSLRRCLRPIDGLASVGCEGESRRVRPGQDG